MPVVYQAEFRYTEEKDKEELSLTRILPDGTQDASPVDLEETYRLEELSRDFKWNQSLGLSQQIGERLFAILIRLNNIGSAWDDLGEHKKAIEYYEQALSIDKEVYGDRHLKVAIRLNNIGSAWTALGDSRRAKEYFQQAYDIFRGFYGDEHPHTRTVKEWLNQL